MGTSSPPTRCPPRQLRPQLIRCQPIRCQLIRCYRPPLIRLPRPRLNRRCRRLIRRLKHMATSMSEADVREIISRVVQRTLGQSPEPTQTAPDPSTPQPTAGVVAFGADHGGFALKETLKEFVSGL